MAKKVKKHSPRTSRQLARVRQETSKGKTRGGINEHHKKVEYICEHCGEATGKQYAVDGDGLCEECFSELFYGSNNKKSSRYN